MRLEGHGLAYGPKNNTGQCITDLVLAIDPTERFAVTNRSRSVVPSPSACAMMKTNNDHQFHVCLQLT